MEITEYGKLAYVLVGLFLGIGWVVSSFIDRNREEKRTKEKRRRCGFGCDD